MKIFSSIPLLSMDKKELQLKIGQNIKRIREEKGLSVSELAAKCSQDSLIIQSIEDGEMDADTYLLYEIAFALSVPLQEIFR